MKKNILFVSNGTPESDLAVIDAATRTAHGFLRASIASHPAQIVGRDLRNVDAVIVNVNEDSRALSIIGAFGSSENAPPVIALAGSQMARVAYCHGATVCVTKPFSAGDLAAVIGNACSHTQPFGLEHPAEVVSASTLQTEVDSRSMPAAIPIRT